MKDKIETPKTSNADDYDVENKENQVVLRNDKKEKRKATPSMYEFSNSLLQSNNYFSNRMI